MKSNLPNDGRQIMAHSKPRKLLYNLVFGLADLSGFWSFPADLDPDDWQRAWNDMYWLYKSRTPVVRAERGSKVEAHFAEQRAGSGSLLPEGFCVAKTATLSAVGDLMNTPGIENSKGRFYDHVADLVFGADVSMANLESTLTQGPIGDLELGLKDPPKINATLAQFDALKGHEGRLYTLFQTANNHILDCGLEGFNATHEQIEGQGFAYVGTNRTREGARRGLVLESNEIRFGFVAATYSLNDRPFPEGKDYLVNVVPFHRFQGPTDLTLLEEQIAWCRSQDCDFVTVSLHWGLEFEFFPRREQIDIAHSLVESGADAIISHHAHNVQPYELYRTRRDPDRVAPIFYGLGNLSSIFSAPHCALSLIVNLGVVKGHVGGTAKTLVQGVNVTPVVQLEHDLAGTPYVRIERLQELMSAPVEGERGRYLSLVASYADLALGPGWAS